MHIHKICRYSVYNAPYQDVGISNRDSTMGFKNRQIAIERTLKIEKSTSLIVKHIIGIAINEETKSLDNKSSALSLKSKIDLLYDCRKLKKEQYTNILHILSIRNQFAHNYECHDFSNLEKFIKGINKALLRHTDLNDLSQEEKLKDGFINMSNQVLSILKVEFDNIVVDYSKELRKAKSNLNSEHNKVLDHYGIKDKEERKIYKKKFAEIIDQEALKARDESLNERVHQRVLELMKQRIEDLEEKLKGLNRKLVTLDKKT